MGRFSQGHYRREREPHGTPDGKAVPRRYTKYDAPGTFSFITEKEEQSGKIRLSYEGRRKYAERLEIIREQKKAREKSTAHRKRHLLLDRLFKNPRPISFETTDGKRVRISRHGFENLFSQERYYPHAFVVTLVEGKLLFFYRSSGINSGQPGIWFPTLGPYVVQAKPTEGKPPILSTLEKMSGHPTHGIKQHFPRWVEEIQETLKKNEKRLVLHPEWGAQDYIDILDALGAIQLTEEIKPRRY